MGSNSTIGATLISLVSKAESIRVTGRDRDCSGGDNRGARDVNEYVGVVFSTKETG